MSQLDVDIRSHIENVIDQSIEDPDLAQKTFREYLITIGIEPNLETMLAMICGNCWGTALRISKQKYGKVRDEDEEGIKELLRR